VDDQNQTAPSNAPADGGDKPADAGTGTIFAPATADPSVNPYDMTQPAGAAPAIGTPAPVFAQPTSPTDDKSAPNVGDAPLNAPSPAPMTTAEPTPATPTAPAADGDLMAIKQAALQNLTPLVDELPQTPEDKFKTMMMLIQASDNSTLIKKAYDAANSIKDEKTRAQALLDIVNEINYFTQKTSGKTS
jgi:hypothetical protein